MSTLTMKNLQKQYPNGFAAVPGLDLDIDDGEFVVLVGPSGCGKTTALRMVAGLEDITGGEIRIGDAGRQRPSPPGPRHRDGVPELRAVPAHDRAREHRLPRSKLRKIPKAEIETARRGGGRDCSSSTQLLDRKPGQLSGGQRQRVAMGRAIVREPQGVPHGRAAVEPRRQAPRADARRDRRSSSGGSASRRVYVTHDQVEAMTMGDRVAVLRTGVLQQVRARPQELYDAPGEPVRGRRSSARRR